MEDEINPIQAIIGILVFFIALIGFGVYKILLQTFYGVITLIVGVTVGVIILIVSIQSFLNE